jgi:hypothetical protein
VVTAESGLGVGIVGHIEDEIGGIGWGWFAVLALHVIFLIESGVFAHGLRPLGKRAGEAGSASIRSVKGDFHEKSLFQPPELEVLAIFTGQANWHTGPFLAPAVGSAFGIGLGFLGVATYALVVAVKVDTVFVVGAFLPVIVGGRVVERGWSGHHHGHTAHASASAASAGGQERGAAK